MKLRFDRGFVKIVGQSDGKIFGPRLDPKRGSSFTRFAAWTREKSVRHSEIAGSYIHHPWMIASCRESYSFQCVHSWPWLKARTAIFSRLLFPTFFSSPCTWNTSLPPLRLPIFLLQFYNLYFYNLWNSRRNGRKFVHSWLVFVARILAGIRRGRKMNFFFQFIIGFVLQFVNLYSLVILMIEVRMRK